MYEIISKDVKINNKLTMRQIMSLYQEMKNYRGSIYIICKHKVVDPANLSKLVSFMLTLDEKSELKVVAEGQDVQSILNNVEKCCQSVSGKEANIYEFYINPAETVQI
ncbi:HPr family phosphocarrier protein [Peribacillus cavernae]|nr:HPr family phosphocarrier protein [Peribacillus cavernae]MDQ0219948.1 phosphotransferase system HPr-like phosphotransfer protein [Peribacillus cavernae]